MEAKRGVSGPADNWICHQGKTSTVTTAPWIDPKTGNPMSEITDGTRHTRHDEGFYPLAAVGAELPLGEPWRPERDGGCAPAVVRKSYRRRFSNASSSAASRIGRGSEADASPARPNRRT